MNPIPNVPHRGRFRQLRVGRLLSVVVLAAPVLVLADLAQAADHETGQAVDYDKIGEILFKFLVIAVVFEAALSTVFNWRFFIKHLEGKGAKTVIAVGLAWFIFGLSEVNIFRDLLKALDPGTDIFEHGPESFAASFVTALLIAGGSDAIFRIYSTLKMRSPEERRSKALAARGDGTIEVVATRAGKAVGPLNLVADNGEPVAMAEDRYMLFEQKAGPHHIVVTSTDAAGDKLTNSTRVVLAPGGHIVANVSF